MSTIVKDRKSKKLHADFYTPDGKHKRISTRTSDKTAAIAISGQAALFARRNHGKAITRLSILDGAEILTKSVNDECFEKCPLATYLPKLAEELGAAQSKGYVKVLVAGRFVSFFEKLGRAEIDIWDVTTGHARTFLADMRKEFDLGDQTIRSYGQILHVMWEAALDARVVKENIMKKIKHPKRPKTSPRRPFSEEELRCLFTFADEEWRGMIVVGVSTGLRIGDVSLMVRSDVNLVQDNILVKARKPNEFEEKPIPPAYRARFAVYCANKKPGDPLFPRAYRWMMQGKGRANGVTNAFRHLLEAAGLRVKGQKVRRVQRIGANKYLPLTFHCLRHNYITMVQILGNSQGIAGALGGPKSAAVTNVYTHFTPQHLQNAVKDYPDYFKDIEDNQQADLPLVFNGASNANKMNHEAA